MKIGTKSLLFGVHQVFIHPLFVLWSWIKLYGLPNWKELICIIVHDWGYWGCGDMDGDEGDNHPVWAACFVARYIDRISEKYMAQMVKLRIGDHYFFNLVLFHSRFLTKYYSEHIGICEQIQPSRLCWADKLGTALYPPWLWVLLGTLTGEIKEYMSVQKHRDFIQETNPFRFIREYRSVVVPKLLKDNLNY